MYIHTHTHTHTHTYRTLYIYQVIIKSHTWLKQIPTFPQIGNRLSKYLSFQKFQKRKYLANQDSILARAGTPICTLTQSEQLWFTQVSSQIYSQPVNTVPPNSFPPTLSSYYSGWGCMVSGCCSARYMYCQHASHCNTLAKDWDKDALQFGSNTE